MKPKSDTKPEVEIEIEIENKNRNRDRDRVQIEIEIGVSVESRNRNRNRDRDRNSSDPQKEMCLSEWHKNCFFRRAIAVAKELLFRVLKASDPHFLQSMLTLLFYLSVIRK